MRLILAVGEGRSIAKPRSNIFWEAIWAAIDSPALSFDHLVGARPRDLQSIATRAYGNPAFARPSTMRRKSAAFLYGRTRSRCISEKSGLTLRSSAHAARASSARPRWP